MRAGELRHRVTIEQKVAGSPQRTPSGAVDDVWTTFKERWAAFEPLSGREFFASEQVQAEVKVRFRLRYTSGITAGMRVVHAGVAYPLVAPPINVGGLNTELHLMCAAGAKRG